MGLFQKYKNNFNSRKSINVSHYINPIKGEKLFQWVQTIYLIKFNTHSYKNSLQGNRK